MPLYNPIDSTAIVDGTVATTDLSSDVAWTRAGRLSSGLYYFASSGNTATTSVTLGNGSFRAVPWVVPNAVTLATIGAEITLAGDGGSKLRIGIYASDATTGLPGALVLDAGVIAGDSATVQEIAVNQALTSGIYWVGGAVQIVTVTQPTVRVISGIPIGPNVYAGTTIPVSNAGVSAVSMASVTGALPGTFTTPVATAGAAPRIFFKVA